MDLERSLIFNHLENLETDGCLCFLGYEPTCYENKNSEKSVNIRKQANQLFSRKNKNHNKNTHEEIWKLYTKSIAYAPNKSEELAAGYANRSALLLHLKKYKECLLDIDRALKITQLNSLKVKLFCRQSECFMALQAGNKKASLDKANFWLSKIDDANERKQLQETIAKTEKIMEIDICDSAKKDKEYHISCKNDAFRMDYSKKFGRHLVAIRDIHVGELVYIEKFYVTSINSTKSYAYCSHCLAVSWATIPCNQCSFYLFCSEKCREEAWMKYHDIECSTKYAKHPEHHFNYFVQLGLRMLIMGFKEVGSVTKLRELTNEIDRCADLKKRGFTRDGKFSSDSFGSLYSLNYSKSVEKLNRCIPDILKILVGLARNTNIFGKDFKYTNNRDLIKNKNAIFIASLLVRLTSISFLNAFEFLSSNVQCEKNENIFHCITSLCCSRGMNLSIFTSLINHSCIQNVDKFYTNDGRVVYYAVQPIKKNSQIFTSYYYLNFAKTEKVTRQQMLSTAFEFRCFCEACNNNWPTIDKISCNHSCLGVGSFMWIKHHKIFEKLDKGKKRRFSNKTIRTFIEDMEFIFKSCNRPNVVTEYFIYSLNLIIEHRYFVTLNIPNSCKSNSKK